MCRIVFVPFWGFKLKLNKRNICNYKGWRIVYRHISICDNLLAGKHWNEMHQYVHKMQFYYLWWIISRRWPPWHTHYQQNYQELYATNFGLNWWAPFHLELHILGPVFCVCVCVCVCVGGGGVFCVLVLSDLPTERKEIWYRDVWRPCWPRDVSKIWNKLMEEMADHIHTASSSMCCPSILLEMKIAGVITKCFQLWSKTFRSMAT